MSCLFGAQTGHTNTWDFIGKASTSSFGLIRVAQVNQKI